MLFMMNRQFNLTRWILLILASFLPLATMAQETADDANKVEEELLPQPKGKPNYVLTMGIIPEGYPLAIKEKNASAIGTLQEYEHKPVLFTLKNISDKTIKITHVESTCPCLELAAPIQDKTLAPQAELPVHFTVNATHLGYGPFDRVLMVAVEGFPVVKMGVLGEVQQSIDYDPSVCIDLGAFYGDVPFKRTYRLKSRFEHDDLKLLQPQDNPLFNLSVKKIAPKTFEIEVTPKKLPLPTQRLREKFIIPVTGVDKFGPVAIAMKGYIIARKLMFTQRSIILKKAELEDDKPVTITAEAIVFPIEKQYRQTKEAKPKLVTKQPVSVEESQLRNLEQLKTWEELAKDVTPGFLPENVTVEKVPFEKGIRFNIVFPAGFFTTRKSFAFSPTFGKSRIGTLQVLVR